MFARFFRALDRFPLFQHRSAVACIALAKHVRVTADEFLRHLVNDIVDLESSSFARDLGIPLGLADAIGVILAGVVTPIDVGEVNGHVFLNNSSIGVYPRVLRLRERYRQRGRSKWIAAFWAILAVLRRHSFMGVRVEADGETIVRRTPFVFVGNNAYRMEGLSAGSRDSLTDGRLVIYMMNAGGRRSLLWLAWNVLIGRTRQLTELEERSVLEAQIELCRGGIQLALDGEVIEERGPLAYRVRPGALRVFTPG